MPVRPPRRGRGGGGALAASYTSISSPQRFSAGKWLPRIASARDHSASPPGPRAAAGSTNANAVSPDSESSYSAALLTVSSKRPEALPRERLRERLDLRRSIQNGRIETLVNAASDFLAAILGKLGFVGRARRRAGIRDDLDLLDRLRDSEAFGSASSAHGYLVGYINLEVAKLAGVELKRKRKIAWGSVVWAFIIGLPLGYLTYKLNQDGFNWVSLFPGLVSALMFLAILGMLFNTDEPTGDSESGTAAGP
ncbi:MAG: hypothetical protein ACRDMH_03255 [Solirubrobacterales bacterium]